MPEADSAHASWRTSSYSYPEHCVEFACSNGVASVRDSQNKNLGIISTTAGEWVNLASTARQIRVPRSEGP